MRIIPYAFTKKKSAGRKLGQGAALNYFDSFTACVFSFGVQFLLGALSVLHPVRILCFDCDKLVLFSAQRVFFFDSVIRPCAFVFQ